jgi:two-component system response regulator YesN
MRLLNVELSNILDELCNGVVHDYAISTYCGFNIVLAVDGLKKESDIVKQLFYNVKKFIKENFDIDIVIGISENYHGLGKISDAYHEAYEQVIKQKYCGYTDTKNIEQTLINKMFMENKKKLIKSIYACDNACAHGIIDLIFDMEFMTGIPVKQIKSMNALLLNGLISVVSDIDYDINEDMGYSKSVYKRLSELRNLENSKQFLNDIIDELIASLKERNIEMKSDLIKSILAYVDENYNKDIKLYAIAEKFNIDSRTLSGLFNEDVGKQFSKYMIEFKINKAKQLLCNTQLKVYEIGEHIGYSDIKYFSKIFKELEGVTPTEYKKRHVKNAS